MWFYKRMKSVYGRTITLWVKSVYKSKVKIDFEGSTPARIKDLGGMPGWFLFLSTV